MPNIVIRVYGDPKPGGSKRYVGRHGGRAVLIDACNGNPTWRHNCAMMALKARTEYGISEVLSSQFRAIYIFYIRRPASHYRRNGDLKPTAPKAPIYRPDVTKLIRSIEDSLTGIIWRDDALCVAQSARKYYADADNPPGAHVIIEWD